MINILGAGNGDPWGSEYRLMLSRLPPITWDAFITIEVQEAGFQRWRFRKAVKGDITIHLDNSYTSIPGGAQRPQPRGHGGTFAAKDQWNRSI